MSCSACHSGRRKFNAEVCIHAPGIENLDKPPVMVFPELCVCVDCGFAEFVIGDRELQLLRNQGAPVGRNEEDAKSSF